MGRWSYGGKTEADYLQKIETSFLRKHGFFNGWRSDTITWTNGYSGNKSSVGIEVSTLDNDDYLRIHYTQTDNDTGKKKDFDYKIPLVTTPCRYGGRRYWFKCPWYKNSIYCGHRVSVLYKDGDYFACRHCYDLTYSSRKENRRYRYYPLFNVMELETKIEQLEEQIKRPYYANKPTRKQQQLLRLYERRFGAYIGLKRNQLI
jgi:hypothetical protein